LKYGQRVKVIAFEWVFWKNIRKTPLHRKTSRTTRWTQCPRRKKKTEAASKSGVVPSEVRYRGRPLHTNKNPETNHRKEQEINYGEKRIQQRIARSTLLPQPPAEIRILKRGSTGERGRLIAAAAKEEGASFPLKRRRHHDKNRFLKCQREKENPTRTRRLNCLNKSLKEKETSGSKKGSSESAGF